METYRKHIPVWLYKKAQKMDLEFEKVKQALVDINILNAGKKRDEALSTLAMWVHEAEKFTARRIINGGSLPQTSCEKAKKLLDKIPKEVLETLVILKVENINRDKNSNYIYQLLWQ